MSDARAGGRRRVSIEASAPEAPADDRSIRISQALRGACKRGELSIVYQPIVHLGTGRVSKGEALVRWTHPELGAVGPAEFIPIAEANGTIHELGDWVLVQAARQAALWRSRGASDFVVSVNRSPVQFHADGDGSHPCLERLREAGVSPECVVLSSRRASSSTPTPRRGSGSRPCDAQASASRSTTSARATRRSGTCTASTSTS
jgi:predicted signal transduction protein with EAL and GGDEF domain